MNEESLKQRLKIVSIANLNEAERTMLYQLLSDRNHAVYQNWVVMVSDADLAEIEQFNAVSGIKVGPIQTSEGWVIPLYLLSDPEHYPHLPGQEDGAHFLSIWDWQPAEATHHNEEIILMSKITEMEQQAAQLQAQISAMQSTVSTLTSQISALQSSIATLTSQASSASSAHNTLKANLLTFYQSVGGASILSLTAVKDAANVGRTTPPYA